MENKEPEKEALQNNHNISLSPEDTINSAGEQMKKLACHLESLRIAQYLDLLERPGKLIATNFVAGIARGLGIAVGASLVFALFLAFLKQLIVLNIPLIGDFIADIIKIVEKKN